MGRNLYISTFPLLCCGKGGEGEEAAAEREKEVKEAEELLRLAADCGNLSAAQYLVGLGQSEAAGGSGQKQARSAQNTECRTQQDREEPFEEGESGRAREKEREALEKTVENPHEQIKLLSVSDFPTMTISLPPGLTGYRRECPVQVHASLHPLP